MQIIQIIQLLGNTNKMCHNFCPPLRDTLSENLLNGPEADLIKSSGEGHHVGRHHQLVLLAPAARRKFIGCDAAKHW